MLMNTYCLNVKSLPVLLALLAVVGCRPAGDDHAESVLEEDATVAGNRIDVPQTVRQNLGMTFVVAERRPVRTTVRIPGQFELKPEAHREYHVMLNGRIELLIEQYQAVRAGDALFHLDSPEWQKMKSDLAAAMNAMRRSHADLDVAQAKHTELQKGVAFLEQRIANLAEASVRQVTLEADLEDKRNRLPRLVAELAASRTEFDAAHTNYEVLLDTAASMTGIDRAKMDVQRDDHGHAEHGPPPWQSINRLTFFAEAAGVVDEVAVTNRGWAETGALILTTIDPRDVRFHGDALQTDINMFRDGLAARIAPPQGGSIDLQDTIDGVISVGYQAHPNQRTIPIFMEPQQLPRWAKPGVTAYLEVFTGGSEDVVLAIPEAAVIRDGLEVVFFRRDPADPDTVIRTPADLGVSDGRWVEIQSGLRLGDEIVLDGVYPLMLASSQSGERQKGGHFHADGTFHDEH